MMSIKILSAYNYLKEVTELFAEYTNMLIKRDPAIEEYLNIQNYTKELEHLESKYGLPDGRLYLAYCNGELAGCIGLRKHDEQSCEMKRLYVRPEFRGKHVGQQLIQQIISDAKDIGYSSMLLDTLPFLQSAVHMYKKFGFYEISQYNDNPIKTSIYMKLELI